MRQSFSAVFFRYRFRLSFSAADFGSGLRQRKSSTVFGSGQKKFYATVKKFYRRPQRYWLLGYTVMKELFESI
jgi:hypothetical protein